jgi:hypothetical protein
MRAVPLPLVPRGASRGLYVVVTVLLLLAGPGLGDSASPMSFTADPATSADEHPEYRIKAAFLYNFIRYTTWPDTAFEDKKAQIEVLLVGEDPFGSVLEKTFKGKKLPRQKNLWVPSGSGRRPIA